MVASNFLQIISESRSCPPTVEHNTGYLPIAYNTEIFRTEKILNLLPGEVFYMCSYGVLMETVHYNCLLTR